MTLRPTRSCAAWKLRLCATAAACALPTGLSGCGIAVTDSSLSAAQIRFVEVSPGSSEVDFYVNGTGAAYGVGYANFTSYLPVSPGAVSVSAHREGSGQMLGSADATMSGGRQYTAVLSHGLGNLQERVYLNQDTPAPTGQVALRVLNEIEGVPAVTVYISQNGANGASGTSPVSVLTLGTGTASAYGNVPVAASYTVTATTAAGALRVPVSNVSVKASSGSVRTIVFAGTIQPGGAHSVVGFVLDDVDAP